MSTRHPFLVTDWPLNKHLAKNKLITLLVILLFNFIQGCTSSTYYEKEQPNFTPITNSKLQARQTKLLAMYQQWRGTPYRLGGNSATGVDCSAFVQHAYQAISPYKLPRTTRSQVLLGTAVNKQPMVTGDLVFFRINGKTRHVGIYINDQQFLHASTSKGVTISNLANSYWRRYYWQTRRILSNAK